MEVEFLSAVWRLQHLETCRFTWGLTNKARIFERIDYFLVSDQLLNAVVHTDIAPVFASDHAIPFLKLKIGPQQRGPGFWKFNISLLQDKDYVDMVNDILEKI